MELSTNHSTAGSWDVFTVEGEVDLATAPQLERELGDVIAEGARHLCLDLSRVAFMDSTGLRVLISVMSDLDDAGGRLAVVAGTGPVSRLISITGLEKRLELYPSVAAATGA